MEEAVELRCVNCGHTWTPAADRSDAVLTYRCPVCQYPVTAEPPEAAGAEFTIDDLAQRLDALIAEARASQLDPEDIVHVLRDELEFAAELSHGGRNLFVQIIDLGPSEGQSMARPVRDRSTVLRRRAVG